MHSIATDTATAPSLLSAAWQFQKTPASNVLKSIHQMSRHFYHPIGDLAADFPIIEYVSDLVLYLFPYTRVDRTVNRSRATYASFLPPAHRSLCGACYLVYDRAIRGTSDNGLFLVAYEFVHRKWSTTPLISRNRRLRGAEPLAGTKTMNGIACLRPVREASPNIGDAVDTDT